LPAEIGAVFIKALEAVMGTSHPAPQIHRRAISLGRKVSNEL
jgi:hypothetical protein